MSNNTVALVDQVPSRKIAAIQNDSRALFGAYISQNTSGSMSFYDAVSVILTSLGETMKRYEHRKSGPEGGYNNAVDHYQHKYAAKWASKVKSVTPATVFELIQELEREESRLLTASIRTDEKDGGRKVTLGLRFLLNDLSKF